ncbi:MAG TPA: DedA family protein [Cyclobacteriaceae bacterium]|jgi:membrane-associated protein|nr:DedA family protein [Cyclobacteriaceae bacterium]
MEIVDLIKQLWDFIVHVDKHLQEFVVEYDNLVYAILFLIIFVETGLVVMPFLPGDSLLFAAGMLAAQGSLSLPLLLILLLIATFSGDNTNYFIGHFFGQKALQLKLFGKPLVKQQHLDKTHGFYEKHGPKTVILARFVPIVRTFAPFVAGVGSMTYKTFITYSLTGAVLWVVGITCAGYFLGDIPMVKNNFDKVVIGIVLVSVLPILFQVAKSYFTKPKVNG